MAFTHDHVLCYGCRESTAVLTSNARRIATLDRELAEARGRTPWSELHERIAELERDLAALRVRLGEAAKVIEDAHWDATGDGTAVAIYSVEQVNELRRLLRPPLAHPGTTPQAAPPEGMSAMETWSAVSKVHASVPAPAAPGTPVCKPGCGTVPSSQPMPAGREYMAGTFYCSEPCRLAGRPLNPSTSPATPPKWPECQVSNDGEAWLDWPYPYASSITGYAYHRPVPGPATPEASKPWPMDEVKLLLYAAFWWLDRTGNQLDCAPEWYIRTRHLGLHLPDPRGAALSPKTEPGKVSGAERIARERQRQVDEEGWTAQHDDDHDGEEMAMAAVCFAAPSRIYQREDYADQVHFLDPWPWDARWDSRRHNGNVPTPEKATIAQRIRLLEKAGALCAAEIDRLLRRKKPAAPPPTPKTDTR